jgi:hypothetical protein
MMSIASLLSPKHKKDSCHSLKFHTFQLLLHEIIVIVFFVVRIESIFLSLNANFVCGHGTLIHSHPFQHFNYSPFVDRTWKLSLQSQRHNLIFDFGDPFWLYKLKLMRGKVK